MHTKWIEDFLALGDTLSFSRASEIRNVTQPALSRRIQALEAWLDVALVDRSTHPFTLTPAGRLFREKSPEILQSLTELKAMLHEAPPGAERFLKITASHSLASSFLPEWLHAMHQKVGRFNSRVGSTDERDAIGQLVARETDLALFYYHPQAPVLLDAAQYDARVLGRESMVPVCAPDAAGRPLHPLPGSPAHPVRFLSYAGDTFMHRVVGIILAHNTDSSHLQPCYETAVSLLLRKMAQLGHGMAWLPESLVAEDLAAGRLVPAGAEPWQTRIEIRACRARDNDNPLLRQLWTELTDGQ